MNAATALLLFVAQATFLESQDSQHVAFPDARLVVNGLAWFEEDKPVLRRLPERLKDSFRPAVWGLAQQPSRAHDETRIAQDADHELATFTTRLRGLGLVCGGLSVKQVPDGLDRCTCTSGASCGCEISESQMQRCDSAFEPRQRSCQRVRH
jgi:hypothetical protein